MDFTIEIDAEADTAEDAADLLDSLSKQMRGIGGQTDDLGSQMQGLGGQMTQLSGTTDGASGSMGGFNEELAGATDGISVVVEAVAAAVAAFGVLLVAVGDVANELKLLNDRMNAAGGAKLVGTVNDLSQKLPESKDKLADMAVKLADMGYSADQVQKALVAMSSANALSAGSGDALINTLRKLSSGGKLTARDLKAIGVSTAELAAAMGMSPKQLEAELKKGVNVTDKVMNQIEDIVTKKGAQPLADEMNSLGTIFDKAKERFLDLFSGIGDSPGFKAFIGAVKSFFSLFSSHTEGMKSGMTNAFSAMFGVAAKVLNWMQVALLKIATFGVKAYIWMFPWLKKFEELNAKYGIVEKFITGLKILGAVVGGIVVGSFVILASVTAAFVAVGTAMVGVVVGIIGGLAKVVRVIVDFVKGALAALSGWVHGAEDAAAKFVAGLMGGLLQGVPGIKDASHKLGDAANSALKESMKVQSPSKVTMEIGQHMGAGLAIGMDNSSQLVKGSAADMGGAAAAGMNASMVAGSSSGGGGGLTVNIESGAVQISGAGGGEELVAMVEEAMVKALERIAVEQGFLRPVQS